MTAAEKKPHLYQDEEFQRFKDGEYYYLTFDRDGVIHKATIYHEELRKFVPITDFVKNDEYWQGRVDEWLADRDGAFVDRKIKMMKERESE